MYILETKKGQLEPTFSGNDCKRKRSFEMLLHNIEQDDQKMFFFLLLYD